MPRWPLVVVLVLYVALAVQYARVTPYRMPGVLMHQRIEGRPIEIPDVGAPDERQHANYIVHLREGKGLPVLVPGAPDLGETYQSHQPPLYYFLAAGWSRLLAADPTDPNAGFRLRLLNILIGIGTILGVYWACVWGFGVAKDASTGALATTAAAMCALMPMMVVLHAAVSNDPLLYLLCTWTLALALYAMRYGWTWRLTLGLSVLVGLGLLTKTTAIALLPVSVLAILLSQKFTGLGRAAALGLAVLPALVIVAPWWMRNQSLYGDPLAMKAFNDAFVGSPKAEAFIQMFGPKHYWLDMVGWWTLRSFFGAFGYMDIFMPDTLYRVLAALTGVLVIGYFMRRKAAEGEMKAAHWTCGALLAIVALMFVQFNMRYFQGQARYLFPAIGPIAVGLGLGATRFMGKYAWMVVAAVLLGLNVYVLTQLPGEFRKRMPAAASVPLPANDALLGTSGAVTFV